MDLSNFNLFFDANKSQCDNDSIGSDVQQLYNFWQCGICHEIFHDKKSELHHQTTAHSGMEHLCKCAICGLNFSDETSKNDHLKKYHLKSNIDDTIIVNHEPKHCPKEDHNASKIIQIVPGDTSLPYHCGICSMAFKFLISLVCHIKINHKIEKKKKSIKREKSDTLIADSAVDYLDMNVESPTEKKCSKIAVDNLPINLKIIVKKNASKCRGIMEPRTLNKLCNDLLTCSNCLQVFKSKIKFIQHQSNCHLDCKTEDVVVGEPHQLANHPGDLKSYVCDGCGVSFSRKNNITKHKKTGACKGFFQQQGKEEEEEMQADNESSNKFTCQKCNKNFKYKQSYTQHINSIHEGHKDYKCESCSKTFAQLHHLTRHRVKVHDHILPHLCTICDSRFVSMIQWKTHMKRYHDVDVEPNVANLITTDETLENDYNTANNKLLLEDTTKKITSSNKTNDVGFSSPAASKSCPAADCKFQTNNISEFNDHIDSVHESRPYKCRKCGIAFKKSYHLKAHDTEVHIGIRPHVCETCGFSFARQSNLLKHQRNKACPSTKPGEKTTSRIRGNPVSAHDAQFLCHQCHKSFKYRQSLQYHIESIHMDKKNFACHMCGRGFTRMQRLREHSARMHGDGLVPPNHSCSECKRDFITSGAFKLHMRKFHSVIITEENIEETKINQTGIS